MIDFFARAKIYRESVTAALDYWLPKDDVQPEKLHAAMRYTVLGEGKRIRPIMVYAAGEAFGVDVSCLNAPACAVEIIHAYSLIHDDLPSMDNDDLRRGRPTCHKAFDEATAIIAGDALQALAFHIMTTDRHINVSCEQRIRMINSLAVASGSRGMAGGQAIDLAAVGKSLNIAELENMHIHKTGALIKASVELGALSVENIDQQYLNLVAQYGKCIGLAFQIKDDILDVESDTKVLGKPQGSDMDMNKPTYPNLLGMKAAKQSVDELYNRAMQSLEVFDERADMLRGIADYIVQRDK